MPAERNPEDVIPAAACRGSEDRLLCVEQKPAPRIGIHQAPMDWSFPDNMERPCKRDFCERSLLSPQCFSRPWCCRWRRRRKALCAAPRKARDRVNTTPVRSARWSAERSARSPARSAASSASRIVRAFANMLFTSGTLPIAMTMTSVSASRCPKAASLITTCRPNTTCSGYRYAYVNDHAVLVDPRTHRIVQIID